MIVRLVSLKIHPGKPEEFRQFSETIYHRIREARGTLPCSIQHFSSLFALVPPRPNPRTKPQFAHHSSA